MFAHSAEATARVLEATACGVPRWAKLSPNVPDLVEIATGAVEGGADGLTLVNTLLGLALDTESGRPVLGAGGGGLSGGAVHPVAVRAVWECRSAFPELPIVGVGGVFSGHDAVELLLAGADAVQVGTATFRDPRAPWKVLGQLARWCDTHGTTVGDIRQQVRQRVGCRRRCRCRCRHGGVPDAPVAPGAAVPLRQRRRTRWLTASETGWPLRSPERDRCARGSIRRRHCSPRWGLSDDANGLRSFCAILRRRRSPAR